MDLDRSSEENLDCKNFELEGEMSEKKFKPLRLTFESLKNFSEELSSHRKFPWTSNKDFPIEGFDNSDLRIDFEDNLSRPSQQRAAIASSLSRDPEADDAHWKRLKNTTSNYNKRKAKAGKKLRWQASAACLRAQ